MRKESTTSSLTLQDLEYQRLREKIVPALLFNQTLYEQALAKCVSSETIWLDAGCGHKILPFWRLDRELGLVNTAKFACGCDVDFEATKRHVSLKLRVRCDLAAMPFKDATFTLISCNMVAEHLDNPRAVFSEFARLLKPGNGVALIHTPHKWSYFALVSSLLPQWIKHRLGKQSGARDNVDFYPVKYRCNTPHKLQRLFADAGMQQEHLSMFASDASLQFFAHRKLGRAILRLELYLLKLSLRPGWRFLRLSICGMYQRPKVEL